MDDEFRKRLQDLDWDSAPDARVTPPSKLDLSRLLKGSDKGGVFVLERSYSEFASPEENDSLLASFRKLGEEGRLQQNVMDASDTDEESETQAPGTKQQSDGKAPDRKRQRGRKAPHLVTHANMKADELLFVDIEATGFIGNLIFLLGVLSIEPEGAVLKQVFARDYTEEKALVEFWLRMVANHPALVSFNGKTYDLPFIRDRIAFHRMKWDEEPIHLDLLHMARRKWKHELPDCKLTTLEFHVCGRRRVGDIPSAEIPYVYHEFVRTGDPEEILKVFHHNALDVITMAELMIKLLDE